MNSERVDNSPEAVKRRFDDACAEIRARIGHRKSRCEAMAMKARRFRLDVTPEFVDKHYEWFLRWDTGVLATGYLMNRTGAKRIERNR